MNATANYSTAGFCDMVVNFSPEERTTGFEWVGILMALVSNLISTVALMVIKLSTLVSNVVDRETQEKIDIVKKRLIENYGYNEESATDVLNYVASIFARGEIKERS